MRRVIIAAIAAVLASLSFGSGAEAWTHGWHGYHPTTDWGPDVLGGPSSGHAEYTDDGYFGGEFNTYCEIRRVRHYDRNGRAYIKLQEICEQ
jgi:hypothetical protein